MCELCEAESRDLVPELPSVAGEPLELIRPLVGEQLDEYRRRRFDRRTLLRRGLIASGLAAIAAPILSEAMRAVAAPTHPFETVGLGSDLPYLQIVKPATTATSAATATTQTRKSTSPTTSTMATSTRATSTRATSKPAAVVSPPNPYSLAPDAAGVPWATSVTPLNLGGPPAPPIVTRAQWGADESHRTNVGAFAPIRKLVVHHTASPTSATDPMSTVRQVYEYHVVTRGYDDVGYNFIIDQYGTIYEGRWARNYAAGELHNGEDTDGWGVVGGHTQGMNCGSCGVVLIGDFSSHQPTSAAVASLTALLAWKAGRHQIDVTADDVYVPLYGGIIRQTPNLAGHRDIGVTACPGGGLYSMLPGIRKQVSKLAGTWPALTINNPKVARFFGNPGPVPNPTPVGAEGGAQTIVKTPAASGVVGYRVLSSNGMVKSVGATSLGGPVGATAASIASARSGVGYLALNTRGDVYGYGGATVLSMIGGKGPGNAVDVAYTASGQGYWILTSGGGVYHFGDAQDAGSPKRQGIADGRKLIGTPSGGGYWILMNDGSVRNYGNAPTLGGPTPKGARGIDIAPTPSGKGYWVLLSNGAVSNFGDAPALGGLSGAVARSPVAIAATPSGKGYVIVSTDGTLSVFGDAPSKGALTGSGLVAVGVCIISS